MCIVGYVPSSPGGRSWVAFLSGSGYFSSGYDDGGYVAGFPVPHGVSYRFHQWFFLFP